MERVTSILARNKPLITSSNSIPTEVSNKMISHRKDLETHHEEANVILTSRAISTAFKNDVHIKMISDDTDVFLLLMHHLADKLNCA